MVNYEVQFKCYLSKTNHTPFIQYKYRKSGKIFWEKNEVVAIDRFASRYWNYEYYDAYDGAPSAADRIRIMRKILDDRYHGKLINYVRAMVEHEIMNELINKEEEYETLDISLTFVTNGWQKINVRLGDW